MGLCVLRMHLGPPPRARHHRRGCPVPDAGLGLSQPPRDFRAAPMRIQDSDREYLISIDSRCRLRSLVVHRRRWVPYDRVRRAQGRLDWSGMHRCSRCYRTFLLLDQLDSTAIRTERCGEGLLIHLPKIARSRVQTLKRAAGRRRGRPRASGD